jgi:site-specific recombinase XerD
MNFNSKKDGSALSNANAFLTGYITLLRKNRVPEETITLYVHWVKEFARHLNNVPLNKCTVTDVKDFLVHLSKNNKIDPAQIEQARQALRVLYRDFFKFGWAMQKISKPTIVISACRESLLNFRKDSGQAGITENPTSKNHTYELLINKLKTEIRFCHYSIRTEQTYVQWAQRFLYFHRTKQVDTIAAEDIKAYLEYLAVQRSVAASTQNQALL